MARCLTKSRSFSACQRGFHVSPSLSTALTLPLFDLHGSASSRAPSSRSLVRAKKFEELSTLLEREEPNPARIWATYSDLMLFFGREQLPIEIHQAVLRRCTPTPNVLRLVSARRVHVTDTKSKRPLANGSPTTPQIHEVRLQTVVRNMRSAGFVPTLDDYHVILKRFAAAGHYVGSIEVYKELLQMKLRPRIHTFGLCLQAIAHRLTLPISEGQRPALVSRVTAVCDDLLQGMQTYNVPFTGPSVDLTIRILKETTDLKGFEMLLKIGYGIDLSYPDHPPITIDRVDSSDKVNRHLAALQPFTTSALNTTIDMLGRLGQTSKMVQAFEVLTQPLQHLASTFDEGDDFGVANPPDAQGVPQLPHAAASTTTYNLLLKHVSRHGHATFARHYLKQAVWLDHITDRTIRGLIGYGKPPHEILAPRFSINKGTILPVFGAANRDKNVELMRRVLIYMRRVIRRKRHNIEFYSGLQAQRDEAAAESPSSYAQARATVDARRAPLPPPTPALDLNLDAVEEPEPVLIKYLDLDLHVAILRKDLREIEEFYEQASDVYSRTLQRVKERLGRRVWGGKNIWFITNPDQMRAKTSRAEWQRLVRFKVPEPKAGEAPDTVPLGGEKHVGPRTQQPIRGIPETHREEPPHMQS
jgi:hypothetical protein